MRKPPPRACRTPPSSADSRAVSLELHIATRKGDQASDCMRGVTDGAYLVHDRKITVIEGREARVPMAS